MTVRLAVLLLARFKNRSRPIAMTITVLKCALCLINRQNDDVLRMSPILVAKEPTFGVRTQNVVSVTLFRIYRDVTRLRKASRGRRCRRRRHRQSYTCGLSRKNTKLF